MSTFKNIQGKNIRSYANNAPNATVGEMWYNQSELKLKGLVSLQAWSSTSNMNTARVYAGSTGTQAAAVIFGGFTPPAIATTEEYNGSGFSVGGSLNTARRSVGGAGTQTAGLAIAGYDTGNTNKTEEYDGSSWTESGNYPASAHNVCGIGIQTAALACGQANPPLTLTNEYGGSSWTSGSALNTDRSHSEGAGTQTAGLTFTGDPAFGSGASATESYDGSSWTTLANVNTARADAGGGGSQTSAIVFGGRSSAPTNTQATENWDGTSWSTSPATIGYSSSNGIGCANQPGSDTANISMGGSAAPASPQVTTSNEYNKSANVITAGAWAASGGLGTARYQIGGAGNVPAGLAYGGYSAPTSFINKTEEYNGTTWSEVNNMANARGQCSGQHTGTQTAALAIGGYLTTSPNYGNLCEEYDGTNWTTGGALTEDSGRSYIAGFGTQTAAVAGGGYAQTGAVSNSENYDGSSWTAGNNMQATAYAASGTGTQTAGLAVGDYPGGSDVEEYDGTNWTTVTAYPAGRYAIHGGMGTQTDCIYAGGSASTTRTTETFGYDGTSWSTRPSLANALSSGASGGTSTSAFIAGGRGSPPGPTAGVTTCEEFTGETTALNIVDITTS